ncbi:MAG: hypothetical protein HQL06_03760 [Nitrospirae bacterium]|nr:hypothetical protein [Nitrospirota bacterium]
MNSLFIICGDTERDLNEFSNIVVLCPIRSHKLEKIGIQNHLFGDFSPSLDDGKHLDIQWMEKLEDCLYEEHVRNPALKWAILFINPIWRKFYRYLWLKECFKNILARFKPDEIFLTSNKDKDLVFALSAVLNDKIILNIDSADTDYMVDKHHLLSIFLPYYIDSKFLVWVYWKMAIRIKKNTKVLFQPYWNLGGNTDSNISNSFNLHRSIGLFSRVKMKILAAFNINKEYRDLIEIDIDRSHSTLLTEHIWQDTSEDERVVINSIMYSIKKLMPLKKVDEIVENLSTVFSVIKPLRIILFDDKIDINRLQAYVAHKHNMAVDYLPHGLIEEHVSIVRKNSSFLPDRMLAWSHYSQEAFQKLGWSSIAVRHPHLQRRIAPLKPLGKNWSDVKVIVPTYDWQITISGREDCLARNIIEILKCTSTLGIKGENVHVKSHPVGTKSRSRQQDLPKIEVLVRIKEEMGIDFTTLDTQLRLEEILSDYDLAIVGNGTPAYLSILYGIPIVVFGVSPNYIGGFGKKSLPFALTGSELLERLTQYDNEEVAGIYRDLSESLQSGRDIMEILVEDIANTESNNK